MHFSLLALSTQSMCVSQQAHFLLLHILTIILVDCCGQHDGKAHPSDHLSTWSFCSYVNICKYGVYKPAACMLPTTTKVTVTPKSPTQRALVCCNCAQCCTYSYALLLLLQILKKTCLYLV